MAQLVTFTIASRGFSISGSETRSYRMSSLPCHTKACMFPLPITYPDGRAPMDARSEPSAGSYPLEANNLRKLDAFAFPLSRSGGHAGRRPWTKVPQEEAMVLFRPIAERDLSLLENEAIEARRSLRVG